MKSNKDNNRQEMRKKYAKIFEDTTNDKCENIPILRESIEESIKLTKLYLEGKN